MTGRWNWFWNVYNGCVEPSGTAMKVLVRKRENTDTPP